MPARLDDQQRLVDLIPRLRRYARAFLGDAASADDLVQETLAQAWANRDLYREGTDLGAWVFTMMHDTCLNDMRRATEPVEDASQDAPDTPGGQPFLLPDLERALAQLGADQRAVLLLITLEGMSYDEVARVLAIPSGTVISRLSQARKSLRALVFGGRKVP